MIEERANALSFALQKDMLFRKLQMIRMPSVRRNVKNR